MTLNKANVWSALNIKALTIQIRVTRYKLRRLPFVVEKPSSNAMQMCVEME